MVTVNNIAHAHATRAAAFEAKIATLDRHQLRILYPQNWIFLAVMSTVQNLTKQVQVPLAPNFRAMPTGFFQHRSLFGRNTGAGLGIEDIEAQFM